MPDVFVAKTSSTNETSRKSHMSKKDIQKKHQHKHHHTSPLAAFNLYPDKIKFIGTDKEEEVILLLRRHPFTNLGWIIIAIALASAPIFLSFFPVLQILPVRFQIISILIWYLIVTAFIFEEFLIWYFNVYIVTDERIFDVDFVNLLYRDIAEANIDQIQDVTSKIGGTAGTILNFGDILIQTASAKPQIEFESVPNPDKVASILRDLRVEEEREKLEGRVR